MINLLITTLLAVTMAKTTWMKSVKKDRIDQYGLPKPISKVINEL